MALNYRLTNIKGWEELCYTVATEDMNNFFVYAKKGEKIIQPITNALIFATLAVGMGEITEENYHEFWARVAAWEGVGGAFLIGHRITLLDVKAHIGLWTNATFKKETNTAFMKKLVLAAQDTRRALERAAEKELEATG